jgi:hypothetical protein
MGIWRQMFLKIKTVFKLRSKLAMRQKLKEKEIFLKLLIRIKKIRCK